MTRGWYGIRHSRFSVGGYVQGLPGEGVGEGLVGLLRVSLLSDFGFRNGVFGVDGVGSSRFPGFQVC